MIIYKVPYLNEIPNNCVDCKCHWCSLPLKRTSKGVFTGDVKKNYIKKRHKECPLEEV